MNFRDFKSKYQSLSYHESSGIDFTRKVENALNEVKQEDLRDRNRIKYVIGLISILALLFSAAGLLLYFRHPEDNAYLGFVLYNSAVVTVIPFLRKEYNQNRGIRYDVPVKEFIEKAERRYKFFHPSMVRLIPFMLIINCTFIFLVARRESMMDAIVLKSQFYFFMLVLFAFLFRALVWAKKRFLLRELKEIKELLSSDI